MSNNIVIIGASSAVAQATAREMLRPSARVVLVGRDQEKLARVQHDLQVRGAAQVEIILHDVLDYAANAALLPEIVRILGSIDVLLVAHGSLPQQQQCEEDFAVAQEAIAVNFLSIVSLLTSFARYFSERRAGKIAVISSVAGERGRQSNFIYGSAKGALSIYLQGLRNRLHPFGVQVLTIKLGFVDTPMTAHIAKGPLMVTPAAVAPGIVKALHRKRDVVYLPWFWAPIMAIIRSIPEFVFKRLSL